VTTVHWYLTEIAPSTRLTSAVQRELEKLDIRFTSVLPQLTPGPPAWGPLRRRLRRPAGPRVATYLKGLGPALTPEHAGKAIVDLGSGPGRDLDAYLLTAAGLGPVQR
jgi:hypothetical protein